MKLKYISGGICAPTGFTAGATHCGTWIFSGKRS